MDLALGVVEAAGAGPAIGAAEDRGRAIFGSDPRQFICEASRALRPRGTRRISGRSCARRARRSSHALRTIGRRMRALWRIAVMKFCKIGEGAGSSAQGLISSVAPFHRAENAPQCALCGAPDPLRLDPFLVLDRRS